MFWRTVVPYKNSEIDETDRILIALTSLALNAPSTYTIAWSKDTHKEELPILYAGIGTSAATVLGAILAKKKGDAGDILMWGGMIATLALFSYVVFCYKPNNVSMPQPYIIGDGAKQELVMVDGHALVI
jgi:hypothetical protein